MVQWTQNYTLKVCTESESNTAIIREFDSTMENDLNSTSAWVLPETSSSGRTPDDLNSVFVKIETDEWHNVANVFYSACAQSEQTLREEIHQQHNTQDSFNYANEKSEHVECVGMDLTKQDGFILASVKLEQKECEVMHQDLTKQDGFKLASVKLEQTECEVMHQDLTKQDGFNLASVKLEQKECEVMDQDLTTQDGFKLASVKLEQTECEVMHQDLTKQDGFKLACVKLEQIECEIMHQNDTRQASVNSICVNTEQTADSNANTEHKESISVCWKTEQSVNLSTDQSCITTNGFSTECRKVKQYIIKNLYKGNTRRNDHNCVCGKMVHTENLKKVENHAKQPDLNSVFVKLEDIETSNIHRNCARPTSVNCVQHVVGKTLKMDHDCNLYIPRDSNRGKDESGLPAIKPDFMKAPSYRTTDFMKGPACRADGAKAVEGAAAQSPMDCVVSDRDEEQTTDLERKEQAQGEELLVWKGDEHARELGFIRDKNLLLRPIYVNGEEVYQCMYCKTAFKTAVPYVRHLRGKHGGDKLTSNDLQVLDQWLRENDHKYLKTYSQHFNLTTFNTKLNSISNVKHNTITSDISHSVCENQVTSAILQKKNVENTNENMYNSEVCNNTSINSSQMQTNMKIHTGKRLHTCDVCGYACNHSSTLKRHMTIHTGERLYKCDVCGKAVNRSDSLKKHMTIHTGERLYKCDVCGKAFNRSGHLKYHMTIHTGESLYKCEVCDYVCNQNCNLKSHMRIHTGEKPLTCEVCGYECCQNGDLKRHMRIHTGERLYKCNVCGYAFNRSGHLKRHMKIHTDERLYTCEVCDYA